MSELAPTPTQDSLPRRFSDFATLGAALDYAALGKRGLNFHDMRGQLSRPYAYSEMREDALKMAYRLISHGIRKDDRIALVAETGIPGILGNCHGSGTDILVEHGEEHMATGKPICYTSADSVFQIAAHEETFGLDRLMALCEVARRLVDEYNIGRVIARPFVGTQADNFVRTGNRRDLSVLPPAPTVLDGLVAAGGAVTSIGKVADIFAHQGITKKIKANGLKALVDATLDEMAAPNKGQDEIIFTNLVDFDMLYGHRRDVNGYAKALETLDAMMPSIMSAMRPDDLLILTADHGCDPTWKGSDHTREHIPVLAFGAGVTAGNLGVRSTFADIGQTLAQGCTIIKSCVGW